MILRLAMTNDYIVAFNESMKEEIKRQSKEGRIIVDFNRLYYLGKKEKTWD
jgi:hypothetical protein